MPSLSKEDARTMDSIAASRRPPCIKLRDTCTQRPNTEEIHQSKPQETSGAVSHGSMVLSGPSKEANAFLDEEIQPAPYQRSMLAGGLLQ